MMQISSIKQIYSIKYRQVCSGMIIYMKKCYSDIKHQFDMWNANKVIKKKLQKVFKKCDCAGISAWIRSTANHFWWCYANCKVNPIHLKEKYASFLYHVVNKHDWKDATIYQSCQHGDLTKLDKLKIVWLIECSPVHVVLEGIVNSKDLLTDLVYLIDFSHTGGVEIYHSLCNKFCSRRLHFDWHGIVAQRLWAVLDFKSGSQCIQAKLKK